MLNMLGKEEIDLTIVKEEHIEFDDYGQNHGNILDNFVSDSEFDTLHDSNVTSCVEEDINVDWLSNFFDEPLHNNLTGLNPPLTNTVSPTNDTHSISKLSSINITNDSMLLDTYSTVCNENSSSINDDCYGLKLVNSPTLRNSNPLLSEVNKKHSPLNMIPKTSETSIDETTVIEIKMEEDITDEQEVPTRCTENIINVNKALENQCTNAKVIPLKSTRNCAQSQQKLLLFMNTPENRAKLAGANFNIINANLLSKFGSQNQIKTNKPLINDKSLSVVNVKRCVSMNDSTRKEIVKPVSPVSISNRKIATPSSMGTSILLRKDKVNLVNELMQSNIMQTIIKKEPDSQEVDSGYESPTNSPSGSPLSPPIDVESTDKTTDTLQYIDIPPHERQPFYLSEEERRTLVIEGLPVPSGLPLNKMEERALKKVRRKIKNKISAQESRRKKKEYMEALEKKVDNYASENNCLKKKVNNLEMTNRSLLLQVEKLQALVANSTTSTVEVMDV